MDPNELLGMAPIAERAGFERLGASDHFHPWRDEGTYTTFLWTWMSSALERTEKMIVGSGVTCPLFRYHPAIVAQAFASMDYIYPGRVYLSVGTGESLNESPLGYDWPGYSERKERLIEAISIIRKLWEGDFTNFEGDYYSLNNAKLYTPPRERIPIYVAAWGTESAKMAGGYGDGFYTTFPSKERVKKKLVPSFQKGANERGRDPSSIDRIAQVSMAYDEDYEKALQKCLSWSSNAAKFDHFFTGGHDPREGDELEKRVTKEEVEEDNYIVTDVDEIISNLKVISELGFSKILINNKSPDKLNLVELFEDEVIPYISE